MIESFCDCGKTETNTINDDPFIDEDETDKDEYCCEDAYKYFRVEEEGTCPFDREVDGSLGTCRCTPAERDTCARDV